MKEIILKTNNLTKNLRKIKKLLTVHAGTISKGSRKT